LNPFGWNHDEFWLKKSMGAVVRPKHTLNRIAEGPLLKAVVIVGVMPLLASVAGYHQIILKSHMFSKGLIIFLFDANSFIDCIRYRWRFDCTVYYLVDVLRGVIHYLSSGWQEVRAVLAPGNYYSRFSMLPMIFQYRDYQHRAFFSYRASDDHYLTCKSSG